VARGSQHIKRRPPTDAGVTPQTSRAAARKAKKPKHASWEDQLFFSRLRVHAKWMFLFLALVFAFSFVIFGVGSGGGVGDVLQDFFSRNSSSSGPSVSSAEKKTRENPKNPAAWRELATALEGKERRDEAIVALDKYTELKPRDESALQELGGLYLAKADAAAQEYVEAQTKSQALVPSDVFKPAAGSSFAQIYQDPLSTAVTAASTETTGAAYSKYLDAQSNAVGVYKKVVALNTKDATNQYRLAQVAQSAGDSTTAIAAYKAFLELAPDDALAPSARKALKALTPTATPSASAG
jgi:tetratricopeptide (TPR) repeat protein